MKITVIYKLGFSVHFKVLAVQDFDNWPSIWLLLKESGICDSDVCHIFRGECVPV